MQIQIDPQSEVPLYQQLRDRVVEAIAGGRLVSGQQLASVRQLAVAFGINVATVGKGYDLLRREGLVRTNQKSGSVVARGPGDGTAADSTVAEWEQRLRTLLAEAVAKGISSARLEELTRAALTEFAQAREVNSARGLNPADGSKKEGSR